MRPPPLIHSWVETHNCKHMCQDLSGRPRWEAEEALVREGVTLEPSLEGGMGVPMDPEPSGGVCSGAKAGAERQPWGEVGPGPGGLWCHGKEQRPPGPQVWHSCGGLMRGSWPYPPPPPQLGAVSMHAFLPQWVSFSCGIRVGSAGQTAPRPAPPPSPEWKHTVCSYTETCTDRRPRAAFTSKPLFRGRTTQLTRREGEGKFHFHAPWRPELHAPQDMSCSRQQDEQCGSSDLPASTCGCSSVAGSLGPAPSCSRWGDGGPRGSGSGESPWFPCQLCSGRQAASGDGGLAGAGEMGRAPSQGAHLRTRVGRVPHPVPCGRCPALMSPLPADVPGLRRAASPTRPGRTSGAGREGCGGHPRTDPLAACVPFPFTAPVAAAVKSSGP